MNKYTYNITEYIRNIRKGYPVSPIAICSQLLNSQYWPLEVIKSYQLKRINSLLYKAINSSEYYKQVLKGADLPLTSLKEYESCIPCINKDIIKKQYDRLRTKYYCTNFKHSSSGSTGDPITIYTSGLADAYREAGLLRFLSWWNINPHDNNVLILGNMFPRKDKCSLKAIMKSKLRNRYFISIFDLNNSTIKKYYDKIISIQPLFIRGYKSAVIHFAELLDENNFSMNKIKLKVAVVTSEVLLEKEREYIEKILQCPVANEYGASDIGQIGYECPHGSMHIYEEAVYLYVNNINEVIATELYNDSMPLINYRNNDRIILNENTCSCGRISRIISHVEGRNEDLIILPNGDKVNPIKIIFIILELNEIGLGNCILKWKIIQCQNNFKFVIVPNPEYSVKVEEYIRKRLLEEFGDDIFIEFSIVDSIPLDKSGKLRIFSRID